MEAVQPEELLKTCDTHSVGTSGGGQQAALSIAWREMYAILAACSTWGNSWARRRILFHCNNAAVVAIWQKGSCKCPHLMSLVRNLFFMAATGNYHVGIAHIPG